MFNMNQFLPNLFQMYKNFYDQGIYHESNIRYFVQIGTLSKENYERIVGEPYDLPTEKMGE